MARYFKEITTRYGDTYDADSTDNISLITSFFNDTSKFSVVGDVITIGADSNVAADRFDGLDADDNPAEFIFFNKQIIVNDGAALVSDAVNGCHFWFVNCSITITGQAPGTGSSQHQFQRLGPAQRGDGTGIGSRVDVVNTGASAKSTDTTWNYYNCTFNVNGVIDDLGVIVAAHVEDCDFNVASPTGGIMRLYPMQNCVWDGITYNLSTSNANQGHAYELFSTPATADGINLINTYGYTGNDQNITYFEYQVVKETAGAYDQPVLYRIFADNEDGSSTNFVNPKADLTGQGNIWWRRPTTQAVAVIRQRLQRAYYSSTNFIPTNGRQDVRLYVDSNFSSTAAGNSINTSVAGSSSNRVFDSGSDGILEGTYNFNNDTTVSSQDWGTSSAPIDIPLFSLKWDSDVAAEGDGDYFGTEEELYTNTVTEMSLWGTTYVAPETRNKANDYRNATEAAADDGRYVKLDIDETVFDVDDPMMAEFSETVNSIWNPFVDSDTESYSLNNFAAGWKYGVWNNDVSFNAWSTSVVNGTTFDVSNEVRNKLHINPSLTNGSAVEDLSTDSVRFRATHDSNNVSIKTESSSHIQTFVCDEVSMETGYTCTLEGGELHTSKITGLKNFTSTPTDFDTDFSVKGTQLAATDGTGALEMDVVGNDTVYVLHDLPSGTNVNVTKADLNDCVVLLTGTTDTADVTTTDNQVSIKKIVQVTLTRPDSNNAAEADLGKVAWRLSDTVANADHVDVTLNTQTGTGGVLSVSGNQYIFSFEVDVDDVLFAAIAIDGFEIEEFVGVGNTTRTLTAINSNNLGFDTSDYTTWGGIDVSSVTVTRPSDSDSSVIARVNATGNITPTQATNDKVRTYLRKNVQESDEYLDGLLLGYITPQLITYGQDNLVFANTQFELNRTAATANSWRVGSVAVNEGGEDLFDLLTKSGTTGEQVIFTPNPTGASISQITNALKGSGNRDLTEVYNQAKGAKNAAYAAG